MKQLMQWIVSANLILGFHPPPPNAKAILIMYHNK